MSDAMIAFFRLFFFFSFYFFLGLIWFQSYFLKLYFS